MPQQQLRLDDSGMRDMLKQLQRRTGMTFADVVRGVARDTLTAAARNTRQAKADMPRRRVEKTFRNRYRAKSGATLTVTSKGFVWYRGAGWPGDRWVLVNTDGKLVSKKQGFRTRGGTIRRQIELPAKLQGEIRRDIREAAAWKRDEMKYLRGQIGSGKAAWLEILRQLRMTPATTRGLGRAMKVNLPPNHRKTLSGSQRGDREQFQVNISSRSQASLNPRSGGIGAFGRALNGQVKRFQNAAKKDVTTYARQFAARNGFEVRG